MSAHPVRPADVHGAGVSVRARLVSGAAATALDGLVGAPGDRVAGVHGARVVVAAVDGREHAPRRRLAAVAGACVLVVAEHDVLDAEPRRTLALDAGVAFGTGRAVLARQQLTGAGLRHTAQDLTWALGHGVADHDRLRVHLARPLDAGQRPVAEVAVLERRALGRHQTVAGRIVGGRHVLAGAGLVTGVRGARVAVVTVHGLSASADAGAVTDLVDGARVPIMAGRARRLEGDQADACRDVARRHLAGPLGGAGAVGVRLADDLVRPARVVAALPGGCVRRADRPVGVSARIARDRRIGPTARQREQDGRAPAQSYESPHCSPIDGSCRRHLPVLCARDTTGLCHAVHARHHGPGRCQIHATPRPWGSPRPSPRQQSVATLRSRRRDEAPAPRTRCQGDKTNGTTSPIGVGGAG